MMFWRKLPRKHEDEHKSALQALDLDPQAKVLVKWVQSGKSGIETLSNGRHLIGNSEFAAIRIPEGKDRISASLTVYDDQIALRCLLDDPCVFVDGRRLVPGEIISVGDVLECYIGRCLLTISACSVLSLPTHQNHSVEEVQDRHKVGDEFYKPSENMTLDSVKQLLGRRLLDHLDLDHLNLSQLDTPEIREKARLRLRKLVSDTAFPDDFPVSKEQVEKEVFNEVMGLGPLEPLLSDSSVSEIMVNGREQIYVERGGALSLANASFSSEQALLNVIGRIVSKVGRRIDASCPIVDARLLDGSRVNAVIPPLALKGPCLTIRRFSKEPLTVEQLVEWGSLTQKAADFMRAMVFEKKNIVVSGGTGSGKTTLLNVLSSFIPSNERIVTIEDAAELQLQQQHVVSLETRPANLEGAGAVNIRDLVKNTLRMRPDRIIVGECRGAEALDMLQAMNTGHDGSLTTAHANSSRDLLRRLETMVMMAGMELPLKAIREQIASAITLVVQQTRLRSGKRQITEITWINGLKSGSESGLDAYQTTTLFARKGPDLSLECNSDAVRSFLEEEGMMHLMDGILI